MNKQAAINLVKKTFEHPYNKDRFVTLTKNLLHAFDEDTFIYRGKYIPEAYNQHIKTMERIGKYEDKDGNKIDILAVSLVRESTLGRARTLQRNFISWYLNGSRGGVTKDAALVAFFVEGAGDWRMSLVKMDYRLDKSESGKLKTITETTPAKRFSFLVGEQENSHTAQRQILPLLQREEVKPTLADLENAFSVEVVTKEFFEKYKQLFLTTKEALDQAVGGNAKIKEDFVAKHIDTVDFTKKLLGQIVFLYFLQKKGWFGVARDDTWGSGPKDFLRLLFERQITAYDNFFNDILEPLFYEALAIERPDDFYSRFNCKIPFLNGGLFDPLNNYDWVHTDIHLPNDLFSNSIRTKEGDTGNGILDVFDRYNFTVKEDEPLEKEVAVDPEMLGKVFENLLEVKDRKSKGTYYTPREIVHYMCQESLVNYLVTKLEGKVSEEDVRVLVHIGETVVEHDTRVQQAGEEKGRYTYKLPKSVREHAKDIDEALVSIKVCDPAVGSGAFLVGMMSEIIRLRNTLSTYLGNGSRNVYAFKHHAIQSSLYGVDIDPGAIEIAKLRLWLSLIVDEQDIKRIKPLPNLDYKIMQGNSLLEEYEGIKLFDEELLTKPAFDNSAQIAEVKDKISELSREFMRLYSAGELRGDKKQHLDSELKKYNNLQKKLTKMPMPKMEAASLFDQVSEAKQKAKELKRLQTEFFTTSHKKDKDRIKKDIERITWELIEATLREQNKASLLSQIEKFKQSNIKPFFLWKLNFSEVFSNGNGGFDVVIANPPYVGNKGHKDEFQVIQTSELGAFYQRRMDLFYFFFHLGLGIVKEKGVVSFITTNYYPTASGATTLRTDFKNRGVITHLVNFNELRIFESALGQHNMITMLKKYHDDNALAFTCITDKKGLASSNALEDIVSGFDKDTKYFAIQQKNLYESEENYIRISGSLVSSSEPMNIVLNKLKEQGERLGNHMNVNQGIVSGADRISKRHLDKFSIKAEKGDGIFVLSPDEITQKGIDKKSIHVKPWYKNSDIRKYWCNPKIKEYLLYFKDVKKVQFIEQPILDHFEKYKDLLIARLSVCKKNKFQWNIVSKWIDRGEYYLLFYPRKQVIFESPKIVVPQRSPSNTFGYNEVSWYASADVYFITEKDPNVSLKYVLGLLNSKLYYLWLYHRGKRKGETLELYQKPLSEIPIKQLSAEDQKPIEEVVDSILDITSDDNYLQSGEKQRLVKQYEKKVDQLVYGLYELTPDEIKLVENYGNS